MHETRKEDAPRPPTEWYHDVWEMGRTRNPADADARMRKVFLEWNSPSRRRHIGGYAWITHALAAYGGDRTVGALRQGIEAWSREGQTRRRHANFMMDALIDIGTPAAMMTLVEMARVQDVPKVWTRANNLIGHHARNARKTPLQFADEAVPRLGLDDQGVRVFDTGARRVRVVFGVDMEPRAFDHDTGERLEVEEAFGEEHEEWAHMRELLERTLEVQCVRLEDAMVTGRRWTQHMWRRTFMAHPIMRTFAQRQVWGLFDRDDALVVTFRGAEDRTFVGVDDETVELDGALEVGLVHPLCMDRGLRSAWSQSFGDYEVFSPVEQLGRATYGREDVWHDGATFENPAFRAQMMHDLWRHDPSSHYKIALHRAFGRGVQAELKLDSGFQSWRAMNYSGQRVASAVVHGDGPRALVAWSETARSLRRVRARAAA